MATKFIASTNRSVEEAQELLTSVGRRENPLFLLFGYISDRNFVLKTTREGFQVFSKRNYPLPTRLITYGKLVPTDNGSLVTTTVQRSRNAKLFLTITPFVVLMVEVVAFASDPARFTHPSMMPYWPCFLFWPLLPLLIGLLVPQIQQGSAHKGEIFRYLKSCFPSLDVVSESESSGYQNVLKNFQERSYVHAQRRPAKLAAPSSTHWMIMKQTSPADKAVARFRQLLSVAKQKKSKLPKLKALQVLEPDFIEYNSVTLQLRAPASQILFRLGKSTEQPEDLYGDSGSKFEIVLKGEGFRVRRRRLIHSPIGRLLLHFMDFELGQQLVGSCTANLDGTRVRLHWTRQCVADLDRLPWEGIFTVCAILLFAGPLVSVCALLMLIFIHSQIEASRVVARCEREQFVEYLGKVMGDIAAGATITKESKRPAAGNGIY